jgi:hypothetical protein
VRIGELSTGLLLAGAGGRGTGKVVGGRCPEETRNKEGSNKPNCISCYIDVLNRNLKASGMTRLIEIYWRLAISNLLTKVCP